MNAKRESARDLVKCHCLLATFHNINVNIYSKPQQYICMYKVNGIIRENLSFKKDYFNLLKSEAFYCYVFFFNYALKTVKNIKIKRFSNEEAFQM